MVDLMTGREGTFVISWSQTEIDGLSGAPVASLEPGTTWLWRGEPVRIDGASGMPASVPGENGEIQRRRAAAGARRIVGRALQQEGVRSPFVEDVVAFERAFTVTDGHRRWVVTLIDMDDVSRPLLMFAGSIPPSGCPLYVSEGVADPMVRHRQVHSSEGVVCFTPGTFLETPEGPRLVEDLVAGDRVVTKDKGAEEILWVGSRHVSGARLYAMPDLRPVRIRGGALGTGRPTSDLIVSPDHRMLVTGPRAQALWGEPEVLVAARDLINDHGIARDMAARSTTYIHLMLPQHHILLANGVETESFHPGMAKLDEVVEDQRLRLFDVLPELEFDRECYGPVSRRVLTRAEAALLEAA